MGSPTEPRSLRLDRSWAFGPASPSFMNARIAVGAVYRIVGRCRATMAQNRSGSGCIGEPSYIIVATPASRMP
jgi:hypothetical protein